jgi:hypothetical protein
LNGTAKKKAPGSAGVLEKSDEKKGRGGSEILESLSEKGGGSLGCASESERESDGIEVNRRWKERVFGGKTVNSIGNSLSKAENKEVLIDSDRNVREEVKGLRLEHNGAEKELRFLDRYTGLSERPDDYWACGDDHDMNMNRSEFAHLSTGGNFARLRNSAGSSRSMANMDQLGVERDGFGGFYRNSRTVADPRGYPTFAYPEEGPSNYKPESFYSYGRRMKHGDGNQDGANRVELLEQNRAELLRKLDELKDQLSRSCDVANNTTVSVDRTPPDPYGGQDIYNVSMQPSALDKHVLTPPYFNRTRETIPFMNRHNMDMPDFYPPPTHVMNEFPAYEDPYQPQMTRRPLHQPSSQYPQRPTHEYFRGRYMELNQDPFTSYQPENLHHQPKCSCLRCLNQNWQVPPRVPPSVFSNKRIQKDPMNSNFYLHDNLGPQSYNPQVANPHQSTSRDPQMYTRWPDDLDSDIDGLGQICPRRVVAACGTIRLCHPIAGGAPFITCYNCFELLKLPRKLIMMEKNLQKLRCGSCSTIIFFKILNKKLLISPEEIKPLSAEADDGCEEVLNESPPSSHGCSNAGNINSHSDDFDNSGSKFDLKDDGQYLQSEDWRLNLSESEKRQGLTSSSISSSEEESPDTVIVKGDVSCSAEQPLRDDLSPTLSGSPLRDQSYCPSDHAVSKYGQGNNSKRMDQDKVVFSRITSRQNSVKDASMTAETEVSCNDYLNTSLSHDSAEVSKEKDQPKIDKGSESIFVGFIKKSLREFSRAAQSLENERPNVLVNGQPIPDRVVKKVEKLAGPIQPGDYW